MAVRYGSVHLPCSVSDYIPCMLVRSYSIATTTTTITMSIVDRASCIMHTHTQPALGRTTTPLCPSPWCMHCGASHLRLCSSVEFAGCGSMFCYFVTSGGGLEFAFVFVSIVCCVCVCGMWNVECGMRRWWYFHKSDASL